MHGKEKGPSSCTRISACLPREEEIGLGERVLFVVVNDFLGVAGAVWGAKIRNVLNRRRACMNGREIDSPSEAAAYLPWDEFGLEAQVCAGSLGFAGAVWGAKIRNVLKGSRAGMHVREIDSPSEAAACLPWDEFGLEAQVCTGSLDVAGAVCAGPEMHVIEIDASTVEQGCSELTVGGVWLGVLTAFKHALAFARFKRLLFFPRLSGGMGYRARVQRRKIPAGIRAYRAFLAGFLNSPPKIRYTQ